MVVKSGLFELELEDLFLLDEKVLNDVYQYYLFFVWCIFLFFWMCIRSDLFYYLSECEVDGVNVINWYYCQFIEVV